MYTNTNKTKTGGILFQLYNKLLKTEVIERFKKQIRIIIFISFKFADVKTRYTIIKRKVLVIIQTLIKIRYLIIES